MNHLTRAVAWVSLVLLCAGAAPTTQHGATTRPSSTASPASHATTKRAGGSGGQAAIAAAMNELSKEFAEHQKDSGKPLRTESNYFKDNPAAAEITPDAILPVLDRGGGDAKQSAYVRWQLLSGLPEVIDEKLAQRLMRAYRTAPLPPLRPGTSPADRQAMDRLIQGAKESDVSELNSRLNAEIAKSKESNAPILAYRNELYKRLPKGAPAVGAGLEDAFERLNAVADAKELIKMISADLRVWAVQGDATPQQIAGMARAVRTLAEYKGPQYYEDAYWSSAKNVVAWGKTTATLDADHELKDLAVFLEEQAKQPPITFKKEPK